MEVTLAREPDLPRLFEVWESSVRATHAFLTEDDIQALIPLVRQGLAEFRPLHCLRGPDGRAYAFMGVEAGKIEMLFVHADRRGSGAGRHLVEYAIAELGATLVDVNEQNGTALGFYERMGFAVAGRSELDATGNPFPILHMALSL